MKSAIRKPLIGMFFLATALFPRFATAFVFLDANGENRIEGTFMAATADHAEIRKRNGEYVKIRLEKLSSRSLLHVLDYEKDSAGREAVMSILSQRKREQEEAEARGRALLTKALQQQQARRVAAYRQSGNSSRNSENQKLGELFERAVIGTAKWYGRRVKEEYNKDPKGFMRSWQEDMHASPAATREPSRTANRSSNPSQETHGGDARLSGLRRYSIRLKRNGSSIRFAEVRTEIVTSLSIGARASHRTDGNGQFLFSYNPSTGSGVRITVGGETVFVSNDVFRSQAAFSVDI